MDCFCAVFIDPVSVLRQINVSLEFTFAFDRVTGLGEFSPFGRLLTLGHILKNAEVFPATFFLTAIVVYQFGPKNYWPKF
jgi:hypothetical protein